MLTRNALQLLEPDTGEVELIRFHVRSSLATRLIRSGIDPLIATDRLAAVDGLFLRRHWLHGPHIQVGWINSAADATPPEVTELVEAMQVALPELVMHASDAYPSASHWLEMSSSLGRVELINGPYAPIHAEGVVVADADERLGAGHIGGPSVRRFRARALSLMGSGLSLVRPDPDGDDVMRLDHCLHALTIMAASYPSGGLNHGYLSLESHARDFLHDHDPDGSLIVAFEPIITRLSEHVLPLVESLVGNELLVEKMPELWQPFAQSCVAVMESGLLLAEQGEIHPYLPMSYVQRARLVGEMAERKWRAGSDRTYSDFHDTLRELDFNDPVEGAHFAAYRHLTALGYEQLGLAGISPRERVVCSLAIGRAVEKVSGIDWSQIFAKGRTAS